MDDDIPPRLPPRYSSLPRRFKENGKASQRAYNQSEPGPSSSTSPVPPPFTRDYQHQSSSRSFVNQSRSSTRQQQSPRRMGNAQSQVWEGEGVRVQGWLEGPAPPPQQMQPVQQLQQIRQDQQGPGRPQSQANRRVELEFAAEHSVLPEGPQVPTGREGKKQKSLRKRFGSFLSFTIRTVVAAFAGTSAADRRARAEQSRPPVKRTQSLTRIDTRSEEVTHRRSQSVRGPPRQREQPPPEAAWTEQTDMGRQPMRAVRADHQGQVDNGGINNLGNTCFVAAALQAMRAVMIQKLMELTAEDRAEVLMLLKDVAVALNNRETASIQAAFKKFTDLFYTLRRIRHGEQDDASLCLLDILVLLRENTKRIFTMPSAVELSRMSVHERQYFTLKFDKGSLFFDVVDTILQTETRCLQCDERSMKYEIETLIPCVIPPQIKEMNELEPLRANFVRIVDGRIQNVRAHLNRFADDLDPNVCELKNQIYDHELIHPFDLERTEVLSHGRDGWERVGRPDNTIVRNRFNEYLSAIEFPIDIPGRLVVVCAYGGAERDGGPLFFNMTMNSTPQELREEMREHLRAYHPFPCDFYIAEELPPHAPLQVVHEQQIMGGTFGDHHVVRNNIRVLKDYYPHLPTFIRITCVFDSTAVPVDDSNDCVSLHRSATRPKYAKKHKIRITVDYVLRNYMHPTRISWRCPNNHEEKSGQIISFCYPAEFIFIQIKRVDHNHNGEGAYKKNDEVYVPRIIDLGPIYRKTWPKHRLTNDNFEVPRIQRKRIMYEFVSVISHEGTVSSSGHYTTCCYDPVTKKVTRYNDSSVTEVDYDSIHKNPFVIIYRHKEGASFAETDYNIVVRAPDAEAVHRTAERKAEIADQRTEGNIEFPPIRNGSERRRPAHVKFDEKNEPRMNPGRPPADLKGSKRSKKAKK